MGTPRDEPGAATARPSPAYGMFRKVALFSMAILVPVLVTGFVAWPRSPVDLGKADNMQSSGLYAAWAAGEVAVLVRHAERCDRSSNPCLDDKNGITEVGRQVSQQVGQAFATLGLGNTDLITSPLVRTVQTAQYMFGKPITVQDWVYNCDTRLLADIQQHKVAQRNLLLVTHSGCISNLESQLDFPHARAADYTSALFIVVGAGGKAKVLGTLNAEEWAGVLAKRAATLKVTHADKATLKM
ncbi:MAG: histidine phosphatase family protein [Pseudomonas sp.]|uniref:lipopolysaccharide core heptose(II)-phosphate phosphatase PmrG n=1 Tax=Pseudomonas abieticivorans TaxID=2931382 RepID=UPI0020BF2382|nr:histidine phosphatase family protein [Pseudomonas sp. PIA16]MDE1165322.1 histidine phosphatase family protein [Pseudomonas sp.]